MANNNPLGGYGIVQETGTGENPLGGYGIVNESVAAAPAVTDEVFRPHHIFHRGIILAPLTAFIHSLLT